MGYFSKACLIVAAASWLAVGTGSAIAQTSAKQPTSSSVAQQFKSGADRVGEGAAQIGAGIKQGAIMTWEAIKSGAAAAAAKFNGGQTSPAASKNTAPSTHSQ